MAETEEEIYNRLKGGMTYQQFLSSGGETALRATARRLYREQFPGGVPPVAGGAGPLPEPKRWWKFWHRESREEQVTRLVAASKNAAATGRFLQRTPGYAKTGYQTTQRGVKTAASYGEKGAGYIDTGFERAGKVSSTAVQKTPVLGGMLFGTVPRGPTPTMEKLPPLVRSAINAARIKLQKDSTGVRAELAILQEQAETEFNTKKAQLKGVKDEIEKIKNEFRKDEGEKGTPQAAIDKESNRESAT